MTILANLSNKQTSTDTVPIPAAGEVQIFVRGEIGPRGRVLVKLRGADGVFHGYDDLTFTRAAAVSIPLLAGDQLRIECINCTAAGVEVRQ